MNVHIAKVVLGLVLTTATAFATDFSSWSYMMGSRFAGYNPPGGATSLTNFPALLILSTNLPGFRYSDFNGTHADLRFTDSTATNELNYQIEKWDTNGSSYVWVQVPRLVNTNSYVWAFWGKNGQTIPAYTTNGATWSEGYLGVWHMSETNALDSTSYRYNSTAYGNTNTTGLADGAQGFGSGAWLQMTAASSSNAVTLEAWVKHTTVPVTIQRYISLASQAAVIRHNGIGQLHFYMFTDPSDTYCPLTVDGAISPGLWYHVAGTWDGVTQRLYKDGLNLTNATPAGTMRSFNNGTFSQSPTETMGGLMDEIRISAMARSSNWLWASWLTMASNNTFSINGPVQNQSFARAVNTVAPAEGVTSDRFDVSQGTKVFLFSPTLDEYPPNKIDPRDLLGATRSQIEAGHTIFATGTVNQTREIRFRTAAPLILTNFQLRVQSDPSGDRSINSYKLDGSADNISYSLISSNLVGVPYNTSPGLSSIAIMFAGTVNTRAFQFFRLRVTHSSTGGGPRIVELDGFGIPAYYLGNVLDPLVFNSIQNAASITSYLDEDPGYATTIVTSATNTVGYEGKLALGAFGGPENANLVFKDANTPDNGDLIFNNGGETVHWISWDSTQPLKLAGINLTLSPADRPAKLMRFLVNGVAQVFQTPASTVYDVTGVTSANNLLFAAPVMGTSFRLEFTGGINGPRLGEIDAILSFELQGTVYGIR